METSEVSEQHIGATIQVHRAIGPGLRRMNRILKLDPNWRCYQALNPMKHGGKYVVIAGGKLIGSGLNLTKLLAMARRKNPTETPFVARMRDPRKVCVFRSA